MGERRKREAQFSYGVTTYHPATGYKYPYGLPYPTVAAPADETDTEEDEMPAVAYAPTPAFPYTHGLPYAGMVVCHTTLDMVLVLGMVSMVLGMASLTMA